MGEQSDAGWQRIEDALSDIERASTRVADELAQVKADLETQAHGLDMIETGVKALRLQIDVVKKMMVAVGRTAGHR